MTGKKRKQSSKRKKVEETLHERVAQSVGRGLDAYFTTESPENVSPSPTDSEAVSDELATFLEGEAQSAGDVFAEVRLEEGNERQKSAERQAEPSPEETPSGAVRRETPAKTEETTVEAPAEPSPEPSPTAAKEEDMEAIAETLLKEAALPPTSAEPPGPPPSPVYTSPPDLRPAGVLMEHPMEVSVAPPGPGIGAPTGIPEPEAEVTPTLSPEEVRERIASERFREVDELIDRLYDEVPRVLANNKPLADEALQSLRTARAILWTAPEQLVDAEYRVNQVKALVTRYRQSEEWGRVYGTRLLIYEIAWLFVLLTGFVLLQLGQTRLLGWVNSQLGPGADTTFTAVIVPFLTALMWGGIGGVVGALYSLWWHVSHLQDFDKRYTMWYLVQPIMGFILGGLVFLIIGTGFLVLQGTVPSPENARGIQLFPPLVAALGGFRQKFVYELLERIIRVLTPTSDA